MNYKMKHMIQEVIYDSQYKGMTRVELISFLNIPEQDLELFYNTLSLMEKQGYLIITKKEKVMSYDCMGYLSGEFIGNKRGYGFVKLDKDIEDKFIPKCNVNGAMNGDRVIISPIGNDYEVVDVMYRANKVIVGTFKKSTDSYGFVTVSDKNISTDIYVSSKYFNNANTDDRVVCEIIKYPKGSDKKPEGKIVECLGLKGEKDTELMCIIKQAQIPYEFSKKVLDEANYVAKSISKEDLIKRLDLREKTTFTIDGEDAKDLDDAISIERLPNGNFELGVHIADVAHYVKEGQKLDKEALKRGTSVYLVDTVLPMLPQQLSNGVCSLNPNEDKLTLSVIMEIDKNGKVVNYDIRETVINSNHKTTYNEISDILEKNCKEKQLKYADILTEIYNAHSLALILNKARMKRGAIDFNLPECKVILDEQGLPTDITTYDRRTANRIIEEFMLIANETVAQHFYWLEVPFAYRVHETPSMEKMCTFNKFISNLGYSIKGSLENVHPTQLQKMINTVKGTPEEKCVNNLMLRSLRQAKYLPICEGHFGLASDYYCHFTSPIRRYPDLQIHRIIKQHLNGQMNEKKKNKYISIVDYSCMRASKTERVAERLEYEVKDYYKAKYMEDKLGYCYVATINNITSQGLFLELDNTVEGFIGILDLNDMYIYNNETYSLTSANNEFKIGDKIDVVVTDVSIEDRKVYFSLA